MRHNPFAIEAWFEHSLTLVFAVPAEVVAAQLPPFLVPDTLGERLAFLAVAVVSTRALRPKGFPRFLGRDFILIGYRYFVRYRDAQGRNLRGLYILRSETNRRSMVWLGNLLTPYRYVRTGIEVHEDGPEITVRSALGLELALQMTAEPEDERLPAGTPFRDAREARRFCGPMPFTFAHDAARSQVQIVEGVRSHWHPELLKVTRWCIPFLDMRGLAGAQLASAFIVQDIPYCWKRGRTEPWPR